MAEVEEYKMSQQDFKLLEQKWSSCKYKPEYDQMLIDHLSEGLSFMSFTVESGISYTTLARWCERFPSFREAREIGDKVRLQWLEKEGLKMIRGGNVIAWKFMMNQMGIHETTKVETSVEHSFIDNPNPQAPIRAQRLRKLKELQERISLEEKTIDAEVVDDSDLDFL